ncbi:MAG TPA: enoyl-CoA hydratase/isomerase family protein [Anaeromyxobacteraceae bacterium]|nr:enoyl-CoA hydratase/isomerase family protein [Anaeromyxobacteraceae bacterium]
MRRHVGLDLRNGIATITMDSPPVNAFTDALHRDFVAVLDALERHPARAAVITGTGPYFQAGGDMNRFLQIETVEDATAFVQMVQGFMDRIAALPFPTIAAVNGYALGGGLEIALACDIRIASRQAALGLPEVRYGILAGAGGTQRLSRLIGPGRAKLLMFTGRRVAADEALAIGLVDAVVDGERLLPEAGGIATEIAANSPIAVRHVKRCVDEGLDLPLEQGLSLERRYWAGLIPHGDYKEGVRAWLEKRKPSFPDAS